jgi:hypothetical protein
MQIRLRCNARSDFICFLGRHPGLYSRWTQRRQWTTSHRSLVVPRPSASISFTNIRDSLPFILLWISISRRLASGSVFSRTSLARPGLLGGSLFRWRPCIIFRTALVSHCFVGRLVDFWKSSVCKQARLSTTERGGTILIKISRRNYYSLHTRWTSWLYEAICVWLAEASPQQLPHEARRASCPAKQHQLGRPTCCDRFIWSDPDSTKNGRNRAIRIDTNRYSLRGGRGT